MEIRLNLDEGVVDKLKDCFVRALIGTKYKFSDDMFNRYIKRFIEYELEFMDSNNISDRMISDIDDGVLDIK